MQKFWNKVKLYWNMVKNDPMLMWWFTQGYFRYFAQNTFLVRDFIKEQYQYRLKNVNKDCLNQGSCVLCSCTILPLLLANKPCAKSKLDRATLIMLFGTDKVCYTQMLDKKSWLKYKKLIN